jgi:hypothetical protein
MAAAAAAAAAAAYHAVDVVGAETVDGHAHKLAVDREAGKQGLWVLCRAASERILAALL